MNQLSAADLLLRQFNSIFVEGSFVGVLIIILARLIFKDKGQTQNAVAIFKWLLVAYASLAIICLIAEFSTAYFSGVEYMQYTLKVNDLGIYVGLYWFLYVANIILPFALLLKKIGRNVYFLFGITLLMNLGWLFQSVVYRIIEAQRDYIPSTDPYYFLPYELNVIKTGITWGVAAVLIGYLISKMKGKNN